MQKIWLHHRGRWRALTLSVQNRRPVPAWGLARGTHTSGSEIVRSVWRRSLFIVLACGAWPVTQALAQQVSIQHSDWEIHTSAAVPVSKVGTAHGDPSLYHFARAIPALGPDWKTLTGPAGSPRNPVDINYLGPNDDYSSDLHSCLTELKFTEFQCFASIPASFLVREATITLGPLDDGARVLIYNRAHSSGVVPDDGYLLIGDNRSIDLMKVLTAGESNRIVVQHMDDCGGQSWLGTAILEVKGENSSVATRPTWGRLKSMYR